VTHKRGQIRKTAHFYEKIYAGDFGQAQDFIVLEATWLGHFEPYLPISIQSYVADMMQAAGQTDLIKTYALQPFEVKVLIPERTFCEKIMSLVRFSYTNDPISDLNKKIRHIYDLHQLLRGSTINVFFNSPAFEDMLLQVANEDVKSFKNNNYWLAHHPSTALIFSATVDTWQQLSDTYHTKFKSLIFGDFPAETAILKTLQKIAERLKPMQWTIKLPTTPPQ
jgi:hypothetical protein